MKDKVLVVGCRHMSLGFYVRTYLHARGEYDVHTAGLDNEDFRIDLTSVPQVHALMQTGFRHIICTAGVNIPGSSPVAMDAQMRNNYFGPMNLLNEWVRYWQGQIPQDNEASPGHFAVISSNSAHVARSGSGAYCASKAALSMGIRCAAREHSEWPFSIYAYEPGWLEDTPMSRAVEARFTGTSQLHRIPGGVAIRPRDLAWMITANLETNRALNGCTIRVDGGEQ